MIVFAQARAKLSKTAINFDTISAVEIKWDTIFVKNIGNKDLIIHKVSYGDGGRPVYFHPKNAIAPGDSGIIVAGISPAAISESRGNYRFASKLLHVVSNSEPEIPDILVEVYRKAGIGAWIEFENLVFDFGTLPNDTTFKVRYVFHNRGHYPLFIKDVTCSFDFCSPNWTKEPIMPNRSSYITLTCNIQNMCCGGTNKMLTVKSNALNSSTALTLVGNVIRREK